jgi:hypothetical protein
MIAQGREPANRAFRASIGSMITSTSAWAVAWGIAVIGAAFQQGTPAPQTPQPEPTLKTGDMAPTFELQGSDGKVHRACLVPRGIYWRLNGRMQVAP